MTFAQEIVISRTDDPTRDQERDGLGAEAALELVQRIHGGADAPAEMEGRTLTEGDLRTDERIQDELGRGMFARLSIGSREVVMRAMTAAEEKRARRQAVAIPREPELRGVGRKSEVFADDLEWEMVAGGGAVTIHRRQIHLMECFEMLPFHVDLGTQASGAHATQVVGVPVGEPMEIGIMAGGEVEQERLARKRATGQLGRTQRVAAIEDGHTSAEIERPLDGREGFQRRRLSGRAGIKQAVITVDAGRVAQFRVTRDRAKEERQRDRAAGDLGHDEPWGGADATRF